ncbi:MAG: VOC family protein [Cereibacter sphaeroides]|uniref:VOC family protein n=1 Tax=Cereibacter sphaeroides TaxID=1063 RepID=A0A2W5UCP8_CERSP|nr:MAG: VOC family protein [Cereibacter sphaeroides]
MITGAPPKVWAMGMPEFLITDLERSLAFWRDVLGFRIAYSRPEQQFVYLEHPDGAQMMMYPRDGYWEVGPMEQPFGRGVVFQVYVTDVDAHARAVSAAGLPFYVEMRERWRHWGDRQGGQREFLVQDPDGYLVMVAQRIGERPLP